MARLEILVVDDERSVRFGVKDYLETHGFEVREAEDLASAEASFRAARPDAVVLDYALPDGTALELLPRLRAEGAGVPIVLLTAHASIDLAVRAIKEGADQFLTKPIELRTLLVVLQRLLENQRNRQRIAAERSRDTRRALDPFVGASPAIRQLEQDARRVLASERPVLLQGETGAGKGVLAAWIHAAGPRAEAPFVDLNCASLSRELLESELFGFEKGAFTGATAAKPGLLEAAHRGTVFLDEIGDADVQVQPRLLKVLEEKRFRRLGDVRDRNVDVRLVAASHHDLEQLVREGRFRSDLYYRIAALPLRVPSLRERTEDLPELARRILERVAADLGRAELRLDAAAMEALQAYAWPGNLRELANVLERAALLQDGEVLRAESLRFGAAGGGPGGVAPDSRLTLEEIERWHIERVLREEKGRVDVAARRLGIPRSTLYERVKRLRIVVEKG